MTKEDVMAYFQSEMEAAKAGLAESVPLMEAAKDAQAEARRAASEWAAQLSRAECGIESLRTYDPKRPPALGREVGVIMLEAVTRFYDGPAE